MKKNKISFETRFWAGFVAGNPFEAFDAIFDFAHLDYYKQNLSQADFTAISQKSTSRMLLAMLLSFILL